MKSAGDRENSFTFLRLFFALTVVFSHSFPLGGFGPDPLMRATGGQAQLGFVAVLCFFIVSGFLITASAVRQPSLARFGLNRAARILPGFWTAQLAVALVMAPILILSRRPEIGGYFDALVVQPASPLSYLARNAFFHVRQYGILDIFTHTPAGNAVNGAMWSLGPEVMCYLALALLALTRLLRWRAVTVLLFAVIYGLHVRGLLDKMSLIAVAHFLEKGGILSFTNPLFRSLYLAFVSGMLCFLFRSWLRWNGWVFTAALALLGASFYGRCFDFAWPFTLPYVVLFLAYRLPFARVERAGDFSYGIYIYSFPMQQCLAFAGLPRFGLFPFMAASLLLALGAGMVSWHWLEEPILNWARVFGKRPARTATSEASALVP